MKKIHVELSGTLYFNKNLMRACDTNTALYADASKDEDFIDNEDKVKNVILSKLHQIQNKKEKMFIRYLASIQNLSNLSFEITKIIDGGYAIGIELKSMTFDMESELFLKSASNYKLFGRRGMFGKLIESGVEPTFENIAKSSSGYKLIKFILMSEKRSNVEILNISIL